MHEPPESRHSEALFADTFAAFLARKERSTEIPWSHDQTDFWFRVTHRDAARPEQGWKIHVSANIHAACDVLDRVLEALWEVPVCFKFTRTPSQLVSLNRGDGSATQVGKFVTVYPQSDEQAVEIARRLDAATAGLSGPAIASDRRLRPHSLVHYRYGSFGGQFLQTAIGAMVPALRAPDGTLVPDRRGTSFTAPGWARDPFAAAGLVEQAAPPSGLVQRRFLPVAKIYSSPFSTVWLAVDVAAGRRCVLKAVRHDLTFGDTDLPASALLRREADMLRLLSPDPAVPVLHDMFDDGERLYLVLEDIDGLTFEQAIAMRRDTHQPIADREVIDWGLQLAGLLGNLHARGFGYLDLKPTNLILTPAGRLRLIDFDAASPLGQPRTISRGTRGYLSPQRVARRDTPVDVSDDVYALGALLYLAATGAEPSLAADAVELLRRPLAVLRPTLHPGLAALIERCLDPEPERRPADMTEVAAMLRALDPTVEVVAPLFGAPVPGTPSRDLYRQAARRLGQTLLQVARPVLGGEGLAWSSSHPTGFGLRSRDINSGSAGALLGLAALACDTAERSLSIVSAVQAGARWLAQAPRPDGEALPGLYVGEGGVLLALLRAAQLSGDAAAVEAVAWRSRDWAALPYGSPDLFNGTAGRLRVHLWLWQETGDEAELVAARRCGDALLIAATRDRRDGVEEWSWVIPPGYDGMSGDRYLGYAHGAAGIADALLDLLTATGDERYVAAIRGAAAWLGRQAITPAGCDLAAVWPAREGEPPATSFWCHGATGVGQFLLRAGVRGLCPDGLPLAERAAWAAARLTRWVGTTRCHGLTGNIELLLDCHQATGRPEFLTEADILGSLLLAWSTEHDGLTVFPSESPTVFTPDYMVGYAGVAPCLLRLARAGRPLTFCSDGNPRAQLPLPAMP